MDYADDVFASLAAEFIAQFDSKDNEKQINFISASANFCKVLLPYAGMRILEKCTGLNKEDFNKTRDALDAASNPLLVEDIIRKRLQSRNQEKQCIEEFKNAMAELAVALKGDTKFPIIFVIDELDRCKPTYVLSVLETIKHFYNVPNVLFMLVTNMEQLQNTVQHQYGTSDPKKYLEKFCDVVLTFGEKNYANRGGEQNPSRYTESLYSNPSPYILDIINKQKVCPRTCNKIVNWFKILDLRTHKEPIWVFQLLCLIKILDNKVFNKLKNKQITFEDFQKTNLFTQELEEPMQILLNNSLPNGENIKFQYEGRIISRLEIAPLVCNVIDDLKI